MMILKKLLFFSLQNGYDKSGIEDKEPIFV